MQLLIDYWKLDPVQVISESKGDGTMKIRGVFGRAEEFNSNNRKYPKAILEREVDKLMPLVKENRLLGELDHPEKASVSLINSSHMITNLYWQGNTLIGEAKVLSSPAGKIAQQLIKDGVKIGVSSRGLGTLKECTEFPGKFEVNEDFKAVTFDLVADPSTRDAFPSSVNESITALLTQTKKESAAQRVLLRIFESRLNAVKDNRINQLFEGASTGQNPITTGARAGRFLAWKGDWASEKDYKRNARIGNRIGARSLKKYKSPILSASARNQFTGASLGVQGDITTQKSKEQRHKDRARKKMMENILPEATKFPKVKALLEGKSTGSNPTATGRRVKKFIRSTADKNVPTQEFAKKRAKRIGNRIFNKTFKEGTTKGSKRGFPEDAMARAERKGGENISKYWRAVEQKK